MSQNSADIYFLEGDITNQSYQVASYENKFVQYSKIKILKKIIIIKNFINLSCML